MGSSSDILVTGLFTTQNIVDIEDVVTVLIIIAIIFHSLAGLGQHAPGVPRGLVVEVRVADTVG